MLAENDTSATPEEIDWLSPEHATLISHGLSSQDIVEGLSFLEETGKVLGVDATILDGLAYGVRHPSPEAQNRMRLLHVAATALRSSTSTIAEAIDVTPQLRDAVLAREIKEADARHQSEIQQKAAQEDSVTQKTRVKNEISRRRVMQRAAGAAVSLATMAIWARVETELIIRSTNAADAAVAKQYPNAPTDEIVKNAEDLINELNETFNKDANEALQTSVTIQAQEIFNAQKTLEEDRQRDELYNDKNHQYGLIEGGIAIAAAIPIVAGIAVAKGDFSQTVKPQETTDGATHSPAQ